MTSEIQLETVDEVSIRHEQAAQTQDNILSSLSPLINSMRMFGLYFDSRRPRVGPAATNQLSRMQSQNMSCLQSSTNLRYRIVCSHLQ